MEKVVPIFEIVIDDDSEESGFIRNSFVEKPAVEIKYFAFDDESDNKKKMIFSQNEKEQIFTSVSILADTPILRKTEEGEDYYVVFTKDTIRKIRNKLVKQGKSNEVSLYHDENQVVDGVYMVENFIVNKGRVESPLFNVPDGSLITSYWVEDKNTYDALLNDEKFNGFSIEINAKIQEMFTSSFEQLYDEKISEKEMESQIKDIVFDDEISEDEAVEKLRKLLDL